MMTQTQTCRVATAHVAPVFLNLQATIDKACSVIAEAAQNGAALVAFPETYVPAFPIWCGLRAPIYNHDLFCQLVANSPEIASQPIEQICQAARQHEILVSLGINEKSSASVGTLYNTNLLIDQTGQLICHHRKLMPTFWEKLTWSHGDGAGLQVCATTIGRVGALICGENTNPLARYSLMAQAEQIHIATYPSIWPSHPPQERGDYDMAEAIQFRAKTHSFEAKTFTLVSSGFLDADAKKQLSALAPDAAAILDGTPCGVSLVTNPSGQLISEVYCESEGILYADLDLSQCVAPKQIHDLTGGYNRFDVFDLQVQRTRQHPIRFRDE